jgi:hypothetical protein
MDLLSPLWCVSPCAVLLQPVVCYEAPSLPPFKTWCSSWWWRWGQLDLSMAGGCNMRRQLHTTTQPYSIIQQGGRGETFGGRGGRKTNQHLRIGFCLVGHKYRDLGIRVTRFSWGYSCTHEGQSDDVVSMVSRQLMRPGPHQNTYGK